MLQVGVVGCGAIGAEICRAIDRGMAEAALAGVSDIDAAKAHALASGLGSTPPVLPRSDLIAASELVVEAVSRAVAPSVIEECLERGRDVLVMSAGGLLERVEEFVALARRQGRRIYVPTGAIAALDAVRGACVASVSRVTLTTRKPPKGLDGAPYVVQNRIDLAAVREPTVIFAGSAREAVPAFPANVNVAAALSLAGIGADRTQVRIVADPTSNRNVHEIEAEGAFGHLAVRMENVPSPDNPKTSYLAALSAIALLQRITAPLVVGT
jgi:aspartate dehydrogenase